MNMASRSGWVFGAREIVLAVLLLIVAATILGAQSAKIVVHRTQDTVTTLRFQYYTTTGNPSTYRRAVKWSSSTVPVVDSTGRHLRDTTWVNLTPTNGLTYNREVTAISTRAQPYWVYAEIPWGTQGRIIKAELYMEGASVLITRVSSKKPVASMSISMTPCDSTVINGQHACRLTVDTLRVPR